MDEMQKKKAQYLKRMFIHLSGEYIGLEEYESIGWFERRGYMYEEARQEVFKKYRNKLLNDDIITSTIVDYEDIVLLFSEHVSEEELSDKEIFKRYINSLSNSFAILCDFSVVNDELIDPNNVIDQIRDTFIANEITQGIKRENSYKSNCSATQEAESVVAQDIQEERNDKLDSTDTQESKYSFSALEWGAAFYYVDSIQALDNNKFIITKIRDFMDKHTINGSIDYLKNHYYEAIKRINTDLNYPIRKLRKIVPFLEEHYPEAVIKVSGDIKYLQAEQLNK